MAQRIRSIEIDDGFLEGLKVEFTDHLNCVIGSRGAGKTTLLELLRHTLQIPSTQRSSHESLVKQNLQAGTVRVVVETPSGHTYTVERARTGPPAVLNEVGELLSVAPEGILETGAYVYSQAEIQEMAETPTDRLALLDRFAEAKLRDVNREISQVARDLETSGSRLLGVTGDALGLEALREDLTRAEEERRSLGTVHELEGSSAFEGETAKKALRESEGRALEGIQKGLTEALDATDDMSKTFLEGLGSWVDREIRTGPNSDLFEQIGTVIEAERAAAQERFKALKGHVQRLQAAREQVAQELAKRHHTQEKTYQGLLKKHKEARAAAAVILEADQKVARIKSQIQEASGKQKGLQRETQTRRELLETLSELREKRSRIRQAVVADLNAELEKPGIQIRLSEQADTEPFRKALALALRGSGVSNQTQIAAQVAQALTPVEFANLVSSASVDELSEISQVSRVYMGRAVDHLKGTRNLYDLEALDLPDEPTILFKDGKQFKATHELSTGQKFTAILPILLLQSDKPLICDEPESHLDQSTLADKIATTIKDLAGRRQLILATHNANLVVLGDAGDTHVVVLGSDGQRALVEEEGSVDATKDRIGKLLEGGPEAFLTRAERYGEAYGAKG